MKERGSIEHIRAMSRVLSAEMAAPRRCAHTPRVADAAMFDARACAAATLCAKARLRVVEHIHEGFAAARYCITIPRHTPFI